MAIVMVFGPLEAVEPHNDKSLEADDYLTIGFVLNKLKAYNQEQSDDKAGS